MQKIYVGVNGTPREVTKVLVGVNGTPREVTEVYVGSNGTPRLSYQSKYPAGQEIFTSSGNFTVPRGIKSIHAFAVGGGAGGGKITIGSFQYMINGGGSGYTSTVWGVAVTPGQVIQVTVGSWGNGEKMVIQMIQLEAAQL